MKKIMKEYVDAAPTALGIVAVCSVFAAIATGIGLLILTGCSQIDAARLRSAIDKTERVTETVCNAAELFQFAGVPQPVTDACARALTTLDSDEYIIISQAVDCVADEKTEQDKAACIAGLEGWSAVADKLVR